ncbi:hypothetical protein SNF32_07880 [Enterococcus mundtii]|nr:hypothetical protein [Enterococcus mundtii]
MEYVITTQEHSDWLSVANSIRQFEWKAAKYIAEKWKTRIYRLGIRDYCKRWKSCCRILYSCKKDIIDTKDYTPNIATVLSRQNIEGSISAKN